jgi:hypothetical protein
MIGREPAITSPLSSTRIGTLVFPLSRLTSARSRLRERHVQGELVYPATSFVS